MEFGPSNLVVIFCLGILTSGLCVERLCESPQYVELYSTAIINCSFQKGFFGVFWYNSSSYRSDYPLITYQESEKEGEGFSTGEFDVLLNGSLIITKVTLQHEHSFAVSYLYSEDSVLEVSVISVLVIVRPLTSFPVINQCGNGSRFCVALSDVHLEVTCKVQNSRPPVELQWLVRTAYGDRKISNETEISTGENWFNSHVATNVSYYISSTLNLFVCKALNPALLFLEKEALLLVQSEPRNDTVTNAITKYFQQNTKLELKCTSKELNILLWKRSKHSNKTLDYIAIASFIGEEVTKVNSNEFFLGKDGSLVALNVGVQHEGFYICWYDGIDHEGVTAYNAVIYVDPVPPYLVINGCNLKQKCVLQTQQRGSLTCSLTGVRPKVKLAWQTLLQEHATLISFDNEQLTLTNDGDTFDVSITSYFEMQVFSNNNLTVVCTVAEPYNELFDFTSKVELWFVFDNTHEVSSKHQYLWVLVVVTLPIAFLGFLFYCRKYAKVFKKNSHLNSISDDPEEEIVPMIEESNVALRDFEAKETLFLKQLKTKYGVLYNALQPIPYIKDKLYPVEKVFVEGGIELLINDGTQGKAKKWRKLDSYRDIITDSEVDSVRLFLEGDTGYGKSTITLQLVYDWCNSLPNFRRVHILVLLQLRQLGSVRSIFEAIKQFLLPMDSPLDQNDVKDILLRSKSTTILLDGYDEYPGRFDEVKSDIMQIIAYDMFQDYKVLLTTRSSVIPPNYFPQTKRLRLSGFDDKARRYYIQKAVAGDDDAVIHKIEKHLEENPVLRALCQVPLLFVVFAHMAHEREGFLKLNSATKYFRYMISTFHSHMRNKMNQAYAHKYQVFENKHNELDRVAFEALRSKRKRLVWGKEELAEKLGLDFYDLYVRIGILKEEEVLNIIDHPKTPISTHIQYRTEVTFYHKMFCEWYAAHYIATKADDPSLNILGDFVRTFDPFEFQYVYRFACGQNHDVAKVIIKYLQGYEEGEQFAVLCILELTGKTDDIQETIRRICKEGVVISGTDALLLQESTLQLLEEASRNKMLIKYVKLYNCIKSVDLASGNIVLQSGLSFSSKICAEGIAIDLIERDMTEEESDGLLQFASMCPALKWLSLESCLPPQTFNINSSLEELQRRNIAVEWQLSSSSPALVLNHLSGRWEDKIKGTELTPLQYKLLKFESNKLRTNETKEIDEARVKHMRAVLRRLRTDE